MTWNIIAFIFWNMEIFLSIHDLIFFWKCLVSFACACFQALLRECFRNLFFSRRQTELRVNDYINTTRHIFLQRNVGIYSWKTNNYDKCPNLIFWLKQRNKSKKSFVLTWNMEIFLISWARLKLILISSRKFQYDFKYVAQIILTYICKTNGRNIK